MGIASLVLGILSMVLGLLPLLPLGGPATLVLAAIGLPLGVVGLCLGLWSRSEALLRGRSLGLYTGGLSTAVVGTLVCATWVGGLVYAQHKIRQVARTCVQNPKACTSVNLPRLSLTPDATPAVGEAPRFPSSVP